MVGLILSASLVLSLSKRSFADEPDINPDLTKPPQLLVIPPSGYKPRPVSAESQKGEAEFKALNCIACHSIHNVGDTAAPVLDGIGRRRSEEFLLARLTDSDEARKKYASLVGPGADMAHIRLTPQTAREITAFLLTVPEPAGGFVISPHVIRLPFRETSIEEQAHGNGAFHPAARSLVSDEGERIYMKAGCVACHSIGKVGGWLAPSLDGIGARRTRQYIVAHISNARAEANASDADITKVSSEMPHLELNAEQIQKIADYLMTLPASD